MDLKKKLYRSSGNRMIAGVCGGIGEYFDVDPVLVRVIFLLLTLMGGSGVFFYVFCWIIIPMEGKAEDRQDKARDFANELKERAEEFVGGVRKKQHNLLRKNILGILIIFLGFILLFNKITPFLSWDLFLLIIVILIGVYLIFKRN